MDPEVGFILHYLKYGENDAIANCFTKNNGFQTFFLKNILSKKSKKKAFLLPFCEISLVPNKLNKNTTIQSVVNIDLVKVKDIYNEIKCNTIVFFVSDILNQLLKNENKNPAIYSEIENFLSVLENNNYRAHLIFLIQILKIQGFEPLLTSHCYLNPENGTFEKEISHHLFNDTISALWKTILTEEDYYTIEMNSLERKQFLDSLLVYLQYHIESFKTPVSLEVIQQIFE